MDVNLTLGVDKITVKLIDAFSKGAGAVYEPTRIVREAKAQERALLIRTYAEIAAEDIRQRAADRFVAQEIRRQENLESILRESVKQVSPSLDGADSFDDDWLNQFTREAQDVSDVDLQKLWAKVLAGEFQAPGRFPRRLFRMIKDLAPNEAKAIQRQGSKMIAVESVDGAKSAILLTCVLEEWILGEEREKGVLGEWRVEDIELFKEIGIVEHIQPKFAIYVEGRHDAPGTFLGAHSLNRISLGMHTMQPSRDQPNFVRTKGPLVTAGGRLRINQWIKIVMLEGWKVTKLGELIFSLSNGDRKTDGGYFEEVRQCMLRSGMLLEESICP